MSEEEKKAIEDSKELINELNDYEGFAGRLYYKNKPIEKILETLLNLIEKLREKLKLVDDYNYWVQLASDRGLELEKLQKENEELNKNYNSLIDKIILIEKLQKENEKYKRLSEMNLKNAEEFKNNMCEHRCLLKSENEELKEFITEGITVAPHSPYKNYRLDFLRENFVSKKKIKDKIEELSKTKGDLATHIAVSERIRVLQELLEEREEKIK